MILSRGGANCIVEKVGFRAAPTAAIARAAALAWLAFSVFRRRQMSRVRLANVRVSVAPAASSDLAISVFRA
jgi:hypothetical protein